MRPRHPSQPIPDYIEIELNLDVQFRRHRYANTLQRLIMGNLRHARQALLDLDERLDNQFQEEAKFRQDGRRVATIPPVQQACTQ